MKQDSIKKQIKITQNDNITENNRYYKESDGAKIDGETCGSNTLSKDRPQLGSLPEFIPFF